MQIAIIGCGNMGRALAQRLSQTHQLFFYDHHPEKAASLAQEGYGKACKTLQEVLHPSAVLILAIKPQGLKEAASGIKDLLHKGQLVVSLLAGTPIETLKGHFATAQIVRMMPNLALIHGEGVIGLSADEATKKGVQAELAGALEVLGSVFWLPEGKMDALTALTGSGPAFFFTIVEAMIDAGIAMGFAAKDAQQLVYQMLQGSLALLTNTSQHPGELKWQIASPQGTTIAGLKKLEEHALRGAVMNTFLAAYEHGRKLSSHATQGK